MVAAYVPLLIMLAIPAVDLAFDGHLVWALFVVVSVLQPSTGAGRGGAAGRRGAGKGPFAP